MDESATLFSLFYLVFCMCFAFRTNEFISAGLTIENLFSKFLGQESDNFIFYHIKRTSLTILVHSFALLGYVLCLSWVSTYPEKEEGLSLLSVIGTLGLILPITTLIIIYGWMKNNWENHPISRKLAVFCENHTTWRTLSSDINIEFRRVDKIMIRCSSLVNVLVTDNWVIKVTPYSMELAHQGDTALSLVAADTHPLSASGTGSAQFLNIRVSFIRQGHHQFYIRLNALDFKDLEDKLRRPVAIAQNIVFNRSRADQFLEVFKIHVNQNPIYRHTEPVELCIGCMVNYSDVKLVQNCGGEGPDPCKNCYCRPMWFASRQEDEHPESWLSSKCTCPVCRSVFCMLDISPIVDENHRLE